MDLPDNQMGSALTGIGVLMIVLAASVALRRLASGGT
jgi:hypothetical protein